MKESDTLRNRTKTESNRRREQSWNITGHQMAKHTRSCLWLYPNPLLVILARNHPKSAKINQHAVNKYTTFWTLMELVTVANAKHPWLGYTHSPESNKSSRWSLMDLVQCGKCKASMPWLYTQSCIQQKQPVEFDGFGTHDPLEYWIHQNLAKTRRRNMEHCKKALQPCHTDRQFKRLGIVHHW